MARLAALVPKPRVNLTRFHGVFAPNSKHRALVTPAKRGKGNKRQENSKSDDCTPAKSQKEGVWVAGLSMEADQTVFQADLKGPLALVNRAKLTI